MFSMSTPVTARFDGYVVDALDRAVEAGLGANRGAIIATAVHEWLQRHGEESIVESYRRRYAEPRAGEEEALLKLASFSVSACLAAAGR